MVLVSPVDILQKQIGFFLLLANLALLYWQWLCDREVIISTNSGFKGLKVSLKFVPYVTLCTEPRSRERMHFAHLKVANGEIWIVSNVRCVHRWGWGGERKRNLHCKLYAAKTGNQPTRWQLIPDTIIYHSKIYLWNRSGWYFTHDLQLTYINR